MPDTVMPEFLIDDDHDVWAYRPDVGPDMYIEITGGDMSMGLLPVNEIRERYGVLTVLERGEVFGA